MNGMFEIADNFDIAFELLADNNLLESKTLKRTNLDIGLDFEMVNEDGLLGHYYSHPGSTAPIILVLGGSEGGINFVSQIAAWIASLGFNTLGLAYFGVEVFLRNWN